MDCFKCFICFIYLISFRINLRKDSVHGWFSTVEKSSSPVILWWTPFTGENGSFRTCGETSCFFTENRSFLTDPLTKVVTFYGSSFSQLDLPIPRLPHHEWALLHEESPKNNPLFCYDTLISLFNFTSTWSRNSNFPLTFLHLPNLESIVDITHYFPLPKKNEFQILEGLSPLVYVQSSCDAPSERDSYISELMKHIKIDSYGKCLNNKKLPAHLEEPSESMADIEFLQLMAKYKFTIAFENAVGEDYITEKLWRPLSLGSVPIYLGSPSIKDWIPNNNSVIVVTDFSSPQSLAEYLHMLDQNDAAYQEKMGHKLDQKIANRNLIDAMRSREWGSGDPADDRENFVEAFECFLCLKASQRQANELSVCSIVILNFDRLV